MNQDRKDMISKVVLAKAIDALEPSARARVLQAFDRATDVQTLDDFCPNWSMALAPDGGHYCLPRGDALAFDGRTPDAARSLAAEWVRRQQDEP